MVTPKVIMDRVRERATTISVATRYEIGVDETGRSIIELYSDSSHMYLAILPEDVDQFCHDLKTGNLPPPKPPKTMADWGF